MMPETRYEAVDGKIVYVCPSDEPHGTCHSRVAALLEAHVTAEHSVAVDMLTRTSANNDMAPDASVFPAARDPKTGGRKLEELVFEVVSTETLSHAAKKARLLTARGVRRVFAVDVEHKRVLAWSKADDDWDELPAGGAIVDATLAAPLPHAALAEAMRSDDAVAHALLAKKNPVLEAALRAARVEARIASLFSILAARELRVTKRVEHRIRDEQDEAVLALWVARAATCPTVDALFAK